jgi:hypothetical protein
MGQLKTDPLHIQYIQYRNLYNKTKRQAKTKYYFDLFHKYKHDIKNTWKTLNEVIGRSNSKPPLSDRFCIDDAIVTEPNSIANGFCKYFTEIGENYASKINAPSHTFDHYLHMESGPAKSFFLKPTDPTEIIDIISSFKPKNSRGHDQISTKSLQNIKSNICTPLSILINNSLMSGIVPDIMNIAKIVPIYIKAKMPSYVQITVQFPYYPVCPRFSEKSYMFDSTAFSTRKNFYSIVNMDSEANTPLYMRFQNLFMISYKLLKQTNVPKVFSWTSPRLLIL